MPTIDLYGISNCDTVKRARAWLAGRAIEVRFHDFKKVGVDPDRLADWSTRLGTARLLNRQGTTWRKLNDGDQAGATDESGAQRLMAAHPGLIRRPVVEWDDGTLTVGFDPIEWARRLDPAPRGPVDDRH